MLRSERAAQFIIEFCRVPEGQYAGEPFVLTDEQHKWLQDIYDSPTRQWILSVGRKTGKTTFAAALVLLHLCGPESVINGQLYSSAQSKDQAAILFNLAVKMIEQSPDLQ